jgi:hypothetical protein
MSRGILFTDHPLIRDRKIPHRFSSVESASERRILALVRKDGYFHFYQAGLPPVLSESAPSPGPSESACAARSSSPSQAGRRPARRRTRMGARGRHGSWLSVLRAANRSCLCGSPSLSRPRPGPSGPGRLRRLVTRRRAPGAVAVIVALRLTEHEKQSGTRI